MQRVRCLAHGQRSVSESSGHYVPFPVEVATQQTFPFWCLEWRAPLRAQNVILQSPEWSVTCHVLGTHAAAFLFLDGSAVCLFRARGRGIPSVLGFREGMEGCRRALAPDASRRELVRLAAQSWTARRPDVRPTGSSSPRANGAGGPFKSYVAG